jgi:dihydrodipicolinate synthase/N-acetylneuraminate lyase
MGQPTIAGVYAAVLTPRHEDDSVDEPALRRLLEFLLQHGIQGVALNGATGEFCLTTPEDLRRLLTVANDVCAGKAEVLCGVGAAGTRLSIELAAIAEKHGVTALLLPMPYFFPYMQQDLEAFCRKVAGATSLPVLLYNLPQFTTGLEKETVRRLITEVPNIIGIKDSSGSLDILRDLTAHGISSCRIVGNDSALAPALLEGVCDGVVSGVACALPELVRSLYTQGFQARDDGFLRDVATLDDFIAHLDPFPTPWGFKLAAEARGIVNATFSQPFTPARQRQAAALTTWVQQWQSRADTIANQQKVAETQ